MTFLFTAVSAIQSYIQNVLDLLAEEKILWTCASCIEIDRDLDGYVALTNVRFMKLFDKLMSVVSDFKEFKADLDNKKKMSVGSPKRKNTAPSLL